MKCRYGRWLGVGMVAALAGAVAAGPEEPAPIEQPVPPGLGSAEGPIEINSAPTPVPGIPYYEYFNYSSYAKRSYVPGYTPHVTSLFENPRDYPWALGNMASPYYQFAGVNGWFFGSPQGYQSSVPKGSHASKYYRGELGITRNLRGGYPQGMRVVEPAIVPVGASAERGGIYIQGAQTQKVAIRAEEDIIHVAAPRPHVAAPRPIAPPVAMPAPTPPSLEK